MAKAYGINCLRNKKGSVQDLAYIGMILLFFSMIILIGFAFTSSLNDRVQGNDIVDSHGQVASQKLTDHFTGIMDNGFMFLTVGLCIATLVLAALVRVHPIFLVFFLLAWLFVVYFSGIMSNVYQEAAGTTALADYAVQLTFTSHIMTYLPLIIGVFGIVLMVVMYKLWSVE